MIEEKKKYERPRMTAIEIQTEAMIATSGDDVKNKNWGGYGDDLDNEG